MKDKSTFSAVLSDFLACPICKAHPLDLREEGLVCPICNRSYPFQDGIFHMLPDELRKGSAQDEEMNVSEPKLCNADAFDAKTIDSWGLGQKNAEEGIYYDRAGMVPDSYTETYERRFAFHLLGKRLKGCFFLDIGAGTLRFALKAREYGCGFAFGIDLRPGRLKYGLLKAKKKGIDNIIPVIADARFLPFQDNVFDNVMCIEVIEHITRNPKGVFREIYRVLKDGGVAVVNVWNALTSWNNPDRKNLGARTYIREGDSYYRYYYPWEFYRLYTSIGFRGRMCGAKIPKSDALAARLGIGKDELEGRLALEKYLSNLAPRLSALLGELIFVRLVK